MIRFFLKSKLHGATITQADLYYEGSLSIDEDIMEEADIKENEQVNVYNVNNGARFTTYAIKAPRGSRTMCANGACSRLVAAGDKVIVCTYAMVSNAEIPGHKPRILLFQDNNHYAQKEEFSDTDNKITSSVLQVG